MASVLIINLDGLKNDSSTVEKILTVSKMRSRRDSQEIIDLDLDYSQAQLSRSPGITGKTQNPVSKKNVTFAVLGFAGPPS